MTTRPFTPRQDQLPFILDGRQTLIVRPMKQQPQYWLGAQLHQSSLGDIAMWHGWPHRVAPGVEPVRLKSPFGVPGDLLWLKEKWAVLAYDSPGRSVLVSYCADSKELGPLSVLHSRCVPKEQWCNAVQRTERRWRPAITMPRWASRYTLRVLDVRAHQLQNTTLYDVVQLGYPDLTFSNKEERLVIISKRHNAALPKARAWFIDFWDNLYAKRGLGWDANPWVFVAEFEVEQ